MPQAKTHSSSRSKDVVVTMGHAATTGASAHELINRMLDYEAACKKSGIDPESGRFQMLTSAEREFIRAELVADYIRLSIGNLGGTPGYYDAALDTFCSKICDMTVPSTELLGTYLAALEIVSTTRRLSRIPSFEETTKRTMVEVLQSCVKMMATRATSKLAA